MYLQYLFQHEPPNHIKEIKETSEPRGIHPSASASACSDTSYMTLIGVHEMHGRVHPN